MKIIEQYYEKQLEKIKIKFAKYNGDFVIKIKFEDSCEKLVNFKPFLNNSQHQSIKKYLKESMFLKFQIIDGNLNWNDYDMIFPLYDLYNGQIT